MECADKIELTCRRYGIGYDIRPLKYGYKRVEIELDDPALTDGLERALQRIRGAAVETRRHYLGGFSARVTVMDARDRAELQNRLDAEQRSVESWWQRYHAADADTRRRMACGEID